MLDHSGQILRKHGDHKSLAAAIPDLLADAAQWISRTGDVLSPRQLLMLRGPEASDSSLCIAIDGHALTVVVLPASLTGRVFGAAAAAQF
jgi:hypothetical protein